MSEQRLATFRQQVTKMLVIFTVAGSLCAMYQGSGYSFSDRDKIYYDSTIKDHKHSNIDFGSPGISDSGIICLRNGEEIISGSNERQLNKIYNFNEAAYEAIERDILLGKQWDGSWDKSLMVDNNIVFDEYNVAYTLIIPRYSRQLRTAALLRSTDGCRTWQAVSLQGRNATIEKHDAFNERRGPPTILTFENYGSKRGTGLWLERFDIKNGRLALTNGAPFAVANDSLLVANHSGGGNSSFTTKDRIYVVYPVTTPRQPGTLSVGREFNRTTNEWSGPAQPIGRSTTKIGPDNHDLPAITVDPVGRPLVVVGAHHATFRMFAAQHIGTIQGGWKDPEPVGMPELGRRFAEYSYVSLNMARDGTINIIARAEYRDGRYQLVQLRRPPQSGWQRWSDGAPDRTIAVPRRNSYAAWRQRVSMAPDGALYLSFAYVPNRLTTDEARTLGLAAPRAADCWGADRCWYRDAPTLGPVTLVSRDNGLTWY